MKSSSCTERVKMRTLFFSALFSFHSRSSLSKTCLGVR